MGAQFSKKSLILMAMEEANELEQTRLWRLCLPPELWLPYFLPGQCQLEGADNRFCLDFVASRVTGNALCLKALIVMLIYI